MGAYYTYMREGIALRTEAERRGIYKKPKATDTKTDDKVTIDWVQIPQAAIKNNNSTVIIANLNPTVK